jgi:hypothetical protein
MLISVPALRALCFAGGYFDNSCSSCLLTANFADGFDRNTHEHNI